jgi:histidine ammonia-lyase
MAMGAARKLRRIVEHVTHVLAIELLCGAVGIDLRQPLRPSAGVARAHAIVRDRVRPQHEDRMPSPDIAQIASAVRAGAFVPASVTLSVA